VILLANGCATKDSECCQDDMPGPAASFSTPKPGATKTPALGTLFDGKTLQGWQITDFAGKGPVTVENGEIRVGMGHMTGITLANTQDLPRVNYELSLDAMRV